MAKQKFERTKPHINIGTIGHVDHGVVLPWSTWPMVPMLQWGLFLSNLALAIIVVLLNIYTGFGLRQSGIAPPWRF